MGTEVLSSGSSQITISVWIKTTNTITGQRVISKETSDYNTPFSIYKYANKFDFFTSKSAGGNAFVDVIFASTGINNGIWHHLVATVSATQATTYLDGILQNTGAWTYGIKASNENTLIGSTKYTPTVATRFFSGNIDEVRIYNRALSS